MGWVGGCGLSPSQSNTLCVGVVGVYERVYEWVYICVYKRACTE